MPIHDLLGSVRYITDADRVASHAVVPLALMEEIVRLFETLEDQVTGRALGREDIEFVEWGEGDRKVHVTADVIESLGDLRGTSGGRFGDLIGSLRDDPLGEGTESIGPDGLRRLASEGDRVIYELSRDGESVSVLKLSPRETRPWDE